MGVLKAAGGVQGALNAAGRSALGTGANLLLHTDWNWRSVMASAAGAAAGAAVGGALDGSRLGKMLGDYGSRVVSGFAGSAVQARVAARHDDHVDYGGLFASTIGNVTGDSIVKMLTPQDPLGDFIKQKLAEQERRDSYTGGRNFVGDVQRRRGMIDAGEDELGPTFAESARRALASQGLTSHNGGGVYRPDLDEAQVIDAAYRPGKTQPNIDWSTASEELLRTVQGASALAAGDVDPLIKASIAQGIINNFTPYVYENYSNGDAPSEIDRNSAAMMRSVIQTVFQENGVNVINPGEPGSNAAFVGKIYSAALADQYRTGVPASISTAQAILESFYGKSVPVDINDGQYSYNLFGIKGSGDAGSVLINTHEVLGGQRVLVQDKFAAYTSFEASIDDHSNFLSRNSRYSSLFESTDASVWANGLQSKGYATDPNYATKLLSIIKRWSIK
jgi:flagellum-specific peptidoglycan hydrolase FlgJ